MVPSAAGPANPKDWFIWRIICYAAFAEPFGVHSTRLGTEKMLLAPLAGAVLAMGIATGPAVEPQASDAHMTSQQKNAAVQPLVRSATDCIARAVMADPRFGKIVLSALGDLIVDSIPTCVRPVRAMIDGYDRYFGDGAGQTFFMGPYLDVLPSMVTKWTADAAQ
jgi:hypothetical protein